LKFSFRLTTLLLLLIPALGNSQNEIDHSGHSGHQMSVQSAGVVMNENHTTLPEGCDSVSRDYAFTISAGRAFAKDSPGMIFGFSDHEIRVDPCSRVEITFINEDQVRHQWMVHGLPKYLYPAGMFHIEAAGGQTMVGTFIVPGDDQTYLVHCDMAQHMEKGMRGQLVVGSGSGDLWNVNGVSDEFYRFSYFPGHIALLALMIVGVAFFTALILIKNT